MLHWSLQGISSVKDLASQKEWGLFSFKLPYGNHTTGRNCTGCFPAASTQPPSLLTSPLMLPLTGCFTLSSYEALPNPSIFINVSWDTKLCYRNQPIIFLSILSARSVQGSLLSSLYSHPVCQKYCLWIHTINKSLKWLSWLKIPISALQKKL